MSKVVVIGGGAAGMFASIAAAGCGHQVVVYEKNEKLGKKLYITGKGRCNITNACDMEGLFDAVRTNAKFLYSSFYGYTNQQVIDFFERILSLIHILQQQSEKKQQNIRICSQAHYQQRKEDMWIQSSKQQIQENM